MTEQISIPSQYWDQPADSPLLLVLHVSQDQFRTAWFVESVMTELLIMLVIRTQKPFFRSKPGKYLLIGTLIVAAVTLILPYSPLSKPLGLTPLPLPLTLLGITFLYVVASEAAKRAFYRRVQL